MDLPLVLARFWGLVLIALCGPFLVNKRGYTNLLEKIKAEEIVFLYSLIAVIVGALSLALLNSWTVDYKGLITILGWSSLLKGFFGLLLPKRLIEVTRRIGKHRSLMLCLLAFYCMLGIWLLFIGLRRA